MLINFKKLCYLIFFVISLLAFACTGLVDPNISIGDKTLGTMTRAALTGGTTGNLFLYNFDSSTAVPNTNNCLAQTMTGHSTFSFSTGSSGQAVSQTSWNAAAKTTDKFFQIILSTSNCTLDKLSFDYRSTSTGPKNYTIYTSTNGTTWTEVTGSASTLTTDSVFHNISGISLASAGLSEKATVYIRICAWGASASTGTLRIDNVKLTGNYGCTVVTTTTTSTTTTIQCSAGNLFIYNFDSSTAVPNTNNCSAQTMTGHSTFSFSTGSSGYAVSQTSWNATAKTTDKFFQVGFNTANGTVDKLSFDYRSTSTGPNNYTIYTSTNGTTWTEVTGLASTLTTDSVFHNISNITIGTVLNNKSTAYIRICAWGASASTGTLRIDNVKLTGCYISGASTTTTTVSTTTTVVASTTTTKATTTTINTGAGTYYNTFISAHGSESGVTFKQSLHDLIKGHTSTGYNWTSDTIDYNLPKNREGISCPSMIFDVYTITCRPLGDHTSVGVNREHTFCNSWMTGSTSASWGNDWHALISANGSENSRRNDHPLAETADTAPLTGTLGNCTTANYTGGTEQAYEPPDYHKGDVARMFFYMSVRYYTEATTWGSSAATEKACLKPWFEVQMKTWNDADAIDTKEVERNNRVYAVQKNRNPFIDHPEWAAKIYSTSSVTTDGF